MAARIVIVDDDMDDIILLNELFSTTEFAEGIQFFSNPEGVIPFFDSLAGNELPSLVITDLNMPKLNGFELLQRLKADSHYRNIPVLAYTTSNSEKDKQRAICLGAKDFITKPTERNGYHMLVEKIRAMLKEEDHV